MRRASFLVLLICCLLLTASASPPPLVWRTVTVDQGGRGDYRTIQQAVNSVSAYSPNWVRILVKKGVYTEKVVVTGEKQRIVLEGEGPQQTMICWGDHETWLQYVYDPKTPVDPFTFKSATLTVFADYFIAKNIGVRNWYNDKEHWANPKERALALLVEGDRCYFYRCSFSGVQDTVCDNKGRHYFRACSVYGSVDFIYGNGQSIYEGCHISTVDTKFGAGWVTAQGRLSPDESTGFVFRKCVVDGRGSTYLGRAWKSEARVVFLDTFMSDVVVPQGWDNWQNPVNTLYFAEGGCSGPGSNMARRVPWERKLTDSDMRFFRGNGFIDNDGWTQQLLRI